jgi:hypothetical protein
MVRVLQWVALAGFSRVVLRCSSRTRRIFVQCGKAAVQKPIPPARGLLRRDFQLSRDLLILQPGASQQNNSRSFHAPRRRAASTAVRFQDLLLIST